MNEYDKTIMAEADRQRQHDLELEKVYRDRELNRLKEKRLRQADRRPFIGYFLIGVAVVTVIISIIVAVARATEQDRRNREREQIRNVEIAKTCIQEGNIWLDGNCLLANKVAS